VPGLPSQFTLAGVDNFNSGAINSYLNFQDYLGIVTLRGKPDSNLSYQISYAAHAISQSFRPDTPGELIFQGVASNASHNDLDNTLQADLTYTKGRHTLSTGVYFGEYRVRAGDTSQVFPVDTGGNQSSSTPITVINNAQATNLLSGVYVNDLWQITDRLKLNVGLRWDDVTGFTANNQVDPTINLTYSLTPQTTVHGGFARYMQVPSFLGISPTAPAAFAGTTAEGPPGISTPLTEDDFEWDAGIVHRLTQKVTLSEDAFFELTDHYLDTGQFGVVPIFAPFNYDDGTIWGSESAISYRDDKLSAYGNVTIGRNLQKGVVTGQFNFDPDELAYINAHPIVLDHQPLYGASGGASYKVQQFTFILDGIYSSGLRGGFADLDKLPTVVQLNAGVQRDFHIPGVGTVSDRLTVLNLLDRTNLIRPSEGIGIFQSSYGPRFTVLNTLSFSFGGGQ
jgi:outer membrane receptor protein involved in Fe transport